jgi:Ras-related GTP-binding protein C/D
MAPDVNFNSGEATKNFYETMYTEIKFVMTSVHDVSLKDAWGRVIQSVLEPLPNLETLLINFSVVSTSDC